MLNFKNGVDTVRLKVKYRETIEGPDQPSLLILAKKNELKYSEYVDGYASNAVAFTMFSCDKVFRAMLSRKIYDSTFTRASKDIGEYQRPYIDVDNLAEGQILYLKCVVYEDKEVFFKRYFFTIIDIDTSSE